MKFYFVRKLFDYPLKSKTLPEPVPGSQTKVSKSRIEIFNENALTIRNKLSQKSNQSQQNAPRWCFSQSINQTN